MRSDPQPFLRDEPLSPEQLRAGTSAVHARMRQRATARALRAVAFTVVLAVAGATVVWRMYPAAPTAPMTFMTTTSESDVHLLDGSLIRLAPNSELLVHTQQRDEAWVELRRGEAQFDVVHRVERRFIVTAGVSTIDVIGTRFVVTLDTAARELRVHVTDGAVMASTAARSRERVDAGQTWAVTLDGTDSPKRTDLLKQTKEVGSQTTPAVPTTEERSPRTKHTSVALSASELLQEARAAAANDEVKLAIELYRSLRKQFPRDPRAGGALFEAGRLLQDRLQAFDAAAEAYADALQLQPDAPWREDAMARQVQTLEFQGKAEACTASRERYLAEYPHGVHAPLVDQSCAWRR